VSRLSDLRWPLLEGGALLLVALACLGFQVWEPTTLVSEREYQACAAALATDAQPGDAVLLAPWWTERARLYLPQGLPIVGYLDSDRDDLEHFARIWVLAEPDLPRAGISSFEKAFAPGRTEVGAERRFGHLSLRLYNNGRYRPAAFSANVLLEQSQVYLEQADGARQDCPWNGRAHQCPNGHAVDLAWHEVHYRPLLCLKFDAPGGATKLVLELPPAAVRGAEAAVLSAGYIWEHAAYKDGVSGVELGLEVEGQVSRLSIPAGLEPLQRVEKRGVPDGARVRVWLTAQNPNARDLCVTLDGFGRGA